MNRFAGIASTTLDAAARAARLQDALGSDGTPIQIVAISRHVSIAHCGNAPLAGTAMGDGRACALFGGCHAGRTAEFPASSVDDPSSAAAALLARHNLTGASFLSDVSGSFLGAISDAESSLWIFADPGGSRLMYVGEAGGDEVVFASHPLVCALLLGDPRIDRSYEDFLLVHGFTPDGRTVYAGVRALQVGTLMHWQAGIAAAAVPTTSRASPEAGDSAQLPMNEEGLHAALKDVLVESLREQLPREEHVGVLLGGFDSALVASLLCRLGKRVTTYSFHYEEDEFNQPHIDTLARFLGTEHRWISITPETIAHGLQRYATVAPQPTNWLNYVIQTVHVCERIREDGIRFAYSGDGCDAIFLGYPGTYKRTSIFARLPHLPPILFRAILALPGHRLMDRLLGHPYRMALNLLRATQRPMPARAFLTFRILDELSLKQLRHSESIAQEETIDEIALRLVGPHLNQSIQRLGYIAKGFVSPNRAKLCASTDVSGVQIFAPYLHPRVKAFCARIPDELLREQDQSGLDDPGKICLMRMASRFSLLPDEVIFQPKLAAIDSPIDKWFSRDLRTQMKKSLAHLPFEADLRYLNSLLDTTMAERLYKKHVGSTRVLSDAASLLATYGEFVRVCSRESREPPRSVPR